MHTGVGIGPDHRHDAKPKYQESVAGDQDRS
jgi:hypothetical protein